MAVAALGVWEFMGAARSLLSQGCSLNQPPTAPLSPAGRVERPLRVLVAHSARAEFPAVEEALRRLGVVCHLVTREEAEAAALAHGSDPKGRNFGDS